MTHQVTINPGLQAALREACIALGGHPLQRILGRIQDEVVDITDSDLHIIRDYVRRMEDYLTNKYPGHDADEPGYSERDEDLYLEETAAYRDKLVFMVADAVGVGFLEE